MHPYTVPLYVLGGMILVMVALVLIISAPRILNEFELSSLCNPLPEGYILTSDYCLEETCACLYETPSDLPLDICVREFRITKNHGIVPFLTTCPNDVNVMEAKR